MAVTFTSFLGLAKPTESELAKKWVDLDHLYGNNNAVLIDQTDITIHPYTPVLTATTTAPNFGTTGSIQGEYQNIKGVIFGSARVIFGDTAINQGTGEYAISLPLIADAAWHSVGGSFNVTPGPFSIVGEGFLYDNTNVATSGPVACDVVTVAGTSYMRMLTQLYTSPAKTSYFVKDSLPFVPADSDRFILNFVYKSG